MSTSHVRAAEPSATKQRAAAWMPQRGQLSPAHKRIQGVHCFAHHCDQSYRHWPPERLLRNMLRYASQDSKQSLAELPAGFDKQLASFGYGEP